MYALVFTAVSARLFRSGVPPHAEANPPYNNKLSSSESETTAKLADAITNVTTVRAFAGSNT